ncbi:MAG: hypothetical protein JXN64_06070 [Spirochaetes bacterium]|nr:hypothetical protein [Spirochaetota bacterium]
MKAGLKIIIYVFALSFLSQFDVQSLEKMGVTISRVERGTYVPGEIVTPQDMRFLPIPAGTNDYAVFQSIKKTSNIIIGKFKTGEREIILIQDNNADGIVDIAAKWSIDLNRIDREGQPDKFCTSENFKKLKEIIVNGRQETIPLGGKNYMISPNKEGIPEIEKLLNVPSNISRHKQGLRIKKIDLDELTKEMMVFSFSVNSENGSADMAFDVKYYYMGRSRISPIINLGVYCLQSEDPFVKETVNTLSQMTSKYIPK